MPGSNGPVRLAHAELLERCYARDRQSDGRFVVGVVTTGIYCLPSCPARRPRPENVRFFATPEEARAAGLRACKRCRPERFYQGADPDGERVLELARSVRARPADFPDVASLARAGGMGATKLTELFRRHFHASPAAFLLDARVGHAARALAAGPTPTRVLEAGLAAGFESSSAFHASFRRRMGMSPGAYRDLGVAAEFGVRLPPGHRREECLAPLGRGDGRSERVAGKRAVKALLLDGRPARLELEFARGGVRCAVRSPHRLGRAAFVAAHRVVARLLALAADPEPFERRARRLGARRLIEGRTGLRVPLTAEPFEALVWVIVGQQVNVAFAAACRDALIALCGEDAGDGFVAHPSAAAVARLEHSDLVRLRFSRRKAEYLIDAARAIAGGELDLARLSLAPVGEARERLAAVRGFGPWSTDYVLMRGFGCEDCVPVGDAGLSAALQRFLVLDRRPDERETARLMERFAPHRSLATMHLWQTLKAAASPAGDPARGET